MPSITKKSDGKYLIRVSRGTGKRRRYINETFHGTLKEANARGRELESRIDGGTSLDAKMRFDEYLPRWLDAVKPRLSPRTLDGYEGYIKRYAETTLGPLRLAEIRTIHIQDVIARCRLSATTVRNLHAALRACFAYAVRGGLLADNPCRRVDLPKRSRRQITVLTIEDAAAFAAACRELPNGLIFEFALETGMRPEEYLALRWSDITGTDVSVQQAVQFNGKGGGFYFKELKTNRSRRRVPISEGLAKRLHRHRIAQHEHRLKLKVTWSDLGLVFANEIGRPHRLTNIIRRYYRPVLDKAGLADRGLTLYSLRHSCATLLMMQGTSPKVVADRLGHSSVAMTLDVYSHVLPHIQNDATDIMARIMGA